jgi:hypothetical protein
MCCRAELLALAGQPLCQRLAPLRSRFPQAPLAKPYPESQSPAHTAPAESNRAAEEQSAVVLDQNKRAALVHCRTAAARRPEELWQLRAHQPASPAPVQRLEGQLEPVAQSESIRAAIPVVEEPPAADLARQ